MPLGTRSGLELPEISSVGGGPLQIEKGLRPARWRKSCSKAIYAFDRFPSPAVARREFEGTALTPGGRGRAAHEPGHLYLCYIIPRISEILFHSVRRSAGTGAARHAIRTLRGGYWPAGKINYPKEGTALRGGIRVTPAGRAKLRFAWAGITPNITRAPGKSFAFNSR